MKAYEDIFLHGTLEPKGVLFNYLSCKAVGERGAVVALYAPVCTELKENKIIILNGSTEDCVTVDTVCLYCHIFLWTLMLGIYRRNRGVKGSSGQVCD